jgi:hypothetical protein
MKLFLGMLVNGMIINHKQLCAAFVNLILENTSHPLRGAIHQSNFYCTAIHHLKVVDKLSMFKNVHFSSSYATWPILDILELYYKTKRHHHASMFKSSKFEVGRVLARLNEIEDRRIDFRFEVTVPYGMSVDSLVIS